MSDALILGLVVVVVPAISSWVIIKLNAKVAKEIREELRQEIVENNRKLGVVETKLDENHKQQNGNLTKLLETTKELATAQEKARGKAEETKKK